MPATPEEIAAIVRAEIAREIRPIHEDLSALREQWGRLDERVTGLRSAVDRLTPPPAPPPAPPPPAGGGRRRDDRSDEGSPPRSSGLRDALWIAVPPGIIRWILYALGGGGLLAAGYGAREVLPMEQQEQSP